MAINNKILGQFHRAFHQSKIYINHTHSTQHTHTKIETLYKQGIVGGWGVSSAKKNIEKNVR